MEKVTIGEALFTKTQQRVLGLLFSNPDKSFYSNEILRWADMGRGTVRRELRRLHSGQPYRLWQSIQGHSRSLPRS